MDLVLEVCVGEGLVFTLLVVVQQLGELVVGDDLTAIFRVLEVVGLDVVAEELGDFDTGAHLRGIPAGEGGDVRGDLDGLHET